MLFEPNDLSFVQASELLEDEVSAIAKAPPAPPPRSACEPRGWALLILLWKYIFGRGVFDPSAFLPFATDGDDDQKVDGLHTERLSGKVVRVTLVQSKSSGGFSEVELAAMAEGLHYVFEAQTREYERLKNPRLVEAIRRVRRDVSWCRRLEVKVLYVALADSSQPLSQKIRREKARLEESWRGRFSQFSVELLGAQSVLARKLQSEAEFKVPEGKLRLEVRRAHQSRPFLQYNSPLSHAQAYVFTATAAKVAQFVNQTYPWIFYENLRVYLDRKGGSINEHIFHTCTTSPAAEYFWLLNNGLTITCDQCRFTQNGKTFIDLWRPQIVNGCQTSVTLRDALDQGKLSANAHVLVRVIQSSNRGLIDRVTEATNSQSAVTLRDLRANDSLQRTLKIAFRQQFGIYYETKRNEYRIALKKTVRRNIVANERCGQAHLAVELGRPALALSQKSAIWGEATAGAGGRPGYHQIFGVSAAKLWRSTQFLRYCQQRRAKSLARLPRKASQIKAQLHASVIKYGHYHLARILAHMMSKHIAPGVSLNDHKSRLDRAYPKAIEVLKKALKQRRRDRRKSRERAVDFFAELKAGETDRTLTSILHG